MKPPHTSASGQGVEGFKGRKRLAREQKIKIVASLAALLVQSRAKQNTLFLLEEKIDGARKEKIVKSILLGGERQRAAAGRGDWIFSGIFDKVGSSFVVNILQDKTF